jgi:outer membrane lipoprotein-sorting protein
MGRKLNGVLPGIIALLAACTALPMPAWGQDASALDLIKRVRDAAPRGPFTAKGTLTSDRGWTREFELSHKWTDGVSATYMEVTAPSDLKGTRFLVLDRDTGRDEQHIYVPATKRSIQVGGQARMEPFLGSEFYVGDLVQPNLDSFDYSFAGEEEVAGRKCKLVEALPKNPAEELYSKSILAVDPTDLLIMKGQFFDDKGKLQKVFALEKVEKIDGIWTPLKQQMVNVQENHWSRFDLSEVNYNVTLPDEVFDRSYLRR